MSAYLFPGQGSQKQGMGNGLFSEFPELVAQADRILGFSIATLCLHDPEGQLNDTAFTQPALYVVNALSYLNQLENNGGIKPDYFLGHSLGEYNALWASGVFDFATGLRLVQKRGFLMSQALGGGMAAVVGLNNNQLSSVLEKNNLTTLSIANYNSYLQQVISGPIESIKQAKDIFIKAGAKLYMPLAVHGAFHSSVMQPARTEFAYFLATIACLPPEIPVIANINALPYEYDDLYNTLCFQIDHPVQWLQSIRYLLLLGESEFTEIGPGKVLTNLVNRIIKNQ
jgi:trans-AT polyketide synthase/acyltransferase/oxidoreductase domain-containing protein